MILNFNFHILFVIRLGKLLSLIFFVCISFTFCNEGTPKNIGIVWKDSQAVAISVPKNYLEELGADSLRSALRVSLEGRNKIPILGEAVFAEDQVIFTPVIPFSRGLSYEIFLHDKRIAKIKMPSLNANNAPSVIAMYPTSDTLPENLLKVYLLFSHPMREGVSLEHISLLNDRGDTLQNVFLPLQPELWNKERTALTLWLDPGRIKRDLIPNQEMGNPLLKGERYMLVVTPDWKDARGIHLSNKYTRQFIASSRDSLSPDVDQWKLDLPTSGTREPLVINTIEPLDYFLLNETLEIVDDIRNRINTSAIISDHESIVRFIPDKPWKSGRYRLHVASYLEDLAGNNLTKVFDRDIRIRQSRQEQTVYERHFVIR